MDAPGTDPMMDLAAAVSDLFGHIGYAFVPEDQLAALAGVLTAFLNEAGIPTDDARVVAYRREVAEYQASLSEGTGRRS